MSKAFREAFPTLKLEEELEGLLDTTEVTKISANHEHTHIRIYLRAKRLIFKKNIWKLEKAITEQIFQNRAIQVKIIESYELSEQYTPKSLIEVYKDSILDELNAYSVLEYNLLRTADMEFPEEDRLILTMDETIIAKTRTDEIIEFLEKVICERCGMNLKIFPQYRKPQESKYRKNSEEQIRQEVAGIVARTKLVMEGKSQETEEKEKTVETEEKTKTIAKTAGNRADTSKNGTNYAKPKQKFEKRGEFRRKFESDNGKKSMNPDVIYGRDFEEESMEIEKIDGPIGEVVIRGKILDRNGNVLAQTNVAEDGTETREYPYNNIFAHVVGYTAQGKSGLESVSNFELLTSNAFFVDKLKNEFQDKKNQGDNVVTTLDTNLQEAAYDALGSNKGAVVVMDPSTGKILAMVSKPDFDPNTVSQNWNELSTSEDSVLLNRATQGQYAPGSTFKLVTTLEFMRENADFDSYSYNCTGSIESGDVTIHCYGGHVHGQVTLRDSLAYSCNTSFSNIGRSLNADTYKDTAQELLFNKKLPSVLPYSKSQFTLTSSDTEAERMMTAMGQGKTQVSPYHMALITSAIANGGTLMKPYLVDSVTNNAGNVIEKTKPEKYKDLMTSKEAAQLKDYMTAVTDYGTSVLGGQNYTAAGKTGTAEYSSDKEKDHSWFVGIANVDNPELVISVIIEQADGSAKAVNIAKKVFDAYYQ